MAVYFIRAGLSGPVKIGVADDAERRAYELQTAHYETLHVLRVVEGDVEIERGYHARYQRQRIRGEWFSYSDDMLTSPPERMQPALVPLKAPRSVVALLDAEAVQADCTLIEGLRGVMRTYAAVGRALGIKQQVVNNWLTRGIPWPRRADVRDLAERHGVSIPAGYLMSRRPSLAVAA